MPLYVMLSRLTDKGRSRVRSHPDRIKEVNSEVESQGFQILAQYALLGDYDFATILRVPDNWHMARLAMDLGARGTIDTVTYPALRVDDWVRFNRAGAEAAEWREDIEDIERPRRPSEADLGPRSSA